MDSSLFYASILRSGQPSLYLPLKTVKKGNRLSLSLSAANIPEDFLSIQLLPTLFSRPIGTEGYYVIPRSGSGALVSFSDRPEASRLIDTSFLPICGGVFEDQSVLMVLEGMKYGCRFSLSLHNGVYSLFPVIERDFSDLYEDISIELYFVTGEDRGYDALARLYRQYKLERGDISLLKDKAVSRPLLDELIHAPEIRVRMAWKPAPPEILHQTLENEPDMFVACTFDRVGELMDALKARGLEKAEFCLVGWNKSGHDGRWPSPFPVEPRLGGEEGLKRLIKKAKSLGYRLVCHSNNTDSYEISEDFSHEITLKDCKQQSVSSGLWSGGKMYELCPTHSMIFAKRDLPKIRSLGFEGDHYIDVMATISPRQCHDPRHPISKGQCVTIWNEILSYAVSLFGGVSSEGAFDFACGVLDFGLYTCFDLLKPLAALEERRIPLWQLVYHGITLSNPSTQTVNYPIKPTENRLTFYEYGGRPAIYVYSAFVTGNHWMGDEDLSLQTEEDLCRTADVIVRMTKEYLPLADLQYQTMDSHRLLENGLVEVGYSKGDRLIFNYTDTPLPYHGYTVAAGSYLWEEA